MASKLTRLKGKVLRNLSIATGDREGEARGKVAETTGHKPDSQEVHEETENVKASHHDYGEPDRG
ncbi:MAG: hypothetical protein QOI61_840 [Actinomycetota bacterium]|jgi:uncharacterized protein YjbJ (UPF0337 family)